MARTQIATRVTPDLRDEINEFADEHKITKAEAMRRLLSSGLDVERGRATMPADEIRQDLRELQERIDADQGDADADQETRVVKSSQLIRSPWRLVQLAATLSVLIIVGGGAL
jgi:hypothetical protein